MHVLVVDDEPVLREALSECLTSWGHRVSTAGDVAEAEAVLQQSEPDLVLSDLMLPGLSGFDLLRRFKSRSAALPVVLITGHADVDAAVEAMKSGATDFLAKPIEPATLRALVDAISIEQRKQQAAYALDADLEDPCVGGLVGPSAAMRDVRAQLAVIASSDATALITGESGTGKEVAARMIHAMSARRAKPFVAINAAAIPEGLMESEIFGHERGAFTGAASSRPGCFEQANGGTLLLDELSEMPIALQPKLLRVLEDGNVRRLGAAREVSFDVRVIASTNRDPMTAVDEGLLRRDLMYRLNVFSVVMPPLRDRAADIPLLARHFVHLFNDKHGAEVQAVRETTMERLQAWCWPGNVRELRNVIERAVVIARDGWIEPSHLPPQITSTHTTPQSLELPARTTLAEAERLIICSTLERTGNNKAEAARQLGLDVKTIRNKLRGWSLDR